MSRRPIPFIGLLCIVCCILLEQFASPGLAQSKSRGVQQGARPRTASGMARFVPVSHPGRNIGSAAALAHTTPQQAAKIRAYLDSVDSTPWEVEDLSSIIAILRKSVPTFVNEPELDLAGIAVDSPMNVSLSSSLTVSARLSFLLEPLELTYVIRNGCLEITTLDAADADPMITVYDVSPLIDHLNRRLSKPRATPAWGSMVVDADFQSLVTALEQHVEPDDWLSAGGVNAITTYRLGGRDFLIVSAPTATQEKVLVLLSTLNGEDPSQPSAGGRYSFRRNSITTGQLPIGRPALRARLSPPGLHNGLPSPYQRLP